MKRIPLTKGYDAIVDDRDYGRTMAYCWHADVRPHTVYASTSMTVNGKRAEVRLHTFITGLPRVDHYNGNGLDNRRRNLRPATQQQNTWNASGNPGAVAKGVTYQKRLHKRPWQARIAVYGYQMHLGYFATAKEASLAYDQAARAYFGKFAFTNASEARK